MTQTKSWGRRLSGALDWALFLGGIYMVLANIPDGGIFVILGVLGFLRSEVDDLRALVLEQRIQK